jgi:hypothetical protein
MSGAIPPLHCCPDWQRMAHEVSYSRRNKTSRIMSGHDSCSLTPEFKYVVRFPNNQTCLAWSGLILLYTAVV